MHGRSFSAMSTAHHPYAALLPSTERRQCGEVSRSQLRACSTSCALSLASEGAIGPTRLAELRLLAQGEGGQMPDWAGRAGHRAARPSKWVGGWCGVAGQRVVRI